MSDFDTVFQVNAEIRDDPKRPAFARAIQVFDEVDCEIALYEADHQIDEYMEQFRARFSDQVMFEDLVKVYRGKFRVELKTFISAAREIMEAAGKGPDSGYHKDDDDGNV